MNTLIKHTLLILADIIILTVVLWLVFSQIIYSFGVAVLITVLAIVLFAVINSVLTKNKGKKYKIISDAIFIAVTVVLLSSVFIYSLPPMMLFSSFDEKASYEILSLREDAEQLSVDTPNGKITGWFYHNAEGNAPLVLYFSGNGESPAGRILKLADGERKRSAFDGYNFACMYYPSYGESEGNPTEKNVKQFALNTYDYLLSRGDVDRIVLCGFSIGSGAANYVASQRDVSGMILIAAYAEGSDLYNSYADIFYGPMKYLISFKMKSFEFAENVELKPLIIQSDSDEIVKYESAVRLSKAFPNGCNFITLNGLNHNEYWNSDEFFDSIGEYLQGLRSEL